MLLCADVELFHTSVLGKGAVGTIIKGRFKVGIDRNEPDPVRPGL